VIGDVEVVACRIVGAGLTQAARVAAACGVSQAVPLARDAGSLDLVAVRGRFDSSERFVTTAVEDELGARLQLGVLGGVLIIYYA